MGKYRISLLILLFIAAIAGTIAIGFPHFVNRLTALSTTSGDKDCGDFVSKDEAQTFFISQGGPGQDKHHLDGDGNGTACQSYRY